MYVLWVANFVVLVALRHWRHLFVWIGVGILVVDLGATLLTVLRRPRPYEVELIGRWAGYSMPSLPITVLTAFLRQHAVLAGARRPATAPSASG